MTKKELWENYSIYENSFCDKCGINSDRFLKICHYNQFAGKEMIIRICKDCFKKEKW